ncbi:MAG: peptidase M50 [Desulfomicrobium sp.]|nr:peptidase M50 [Pseudomonadota bacterium]MBV1713464.1 peptidase M50 [Desulfomicrobium sp.]MBU4570402.1 peptidase M50 [Pseudomonadota bacterium]MBU4593759.1 peptidase M50 [Pseudomonadota bacterium]MBV1719787.1 peptidase M50 [Desulfomicrobium sp.]
MSASLLSPSWYRVAPLKPRLRSHVRIERHEYRGQDWYVIQDGFTGRHHRFSPEAYQLVGMMDGRRTMDQIWQAVCTRLGDHMPTQDEVIELLSRLYRADLLQTSAILDFSDLHERSLQGRRHRLFARLASPLSLRFPLVDPDRFLTRTMSLVRPLLGWQALVAWVALVGAAAVLAVLHWDALQGDFSDALLGMENLLLFSLIYPVLKILHEFGHAYMVKKEGGEVHEMGVMLLVFMPLPYVDASSSTSFRDKRQRMLVGGAGIMVELFVAAVMLLVWLNVEPGAVRALAYKTLLVAGVSTILFNGNPLLRFDAYYILSDWLEIPNLAQRGVGYLGYLFKRYLLGVESAESPARSRGEARWLFFYAVAAFCYRIFISVQIVIFVAGQFFFVGIILAMWAVFMMLVMPLWRVARFLVKDVHMQRKRMRVMMTVVLPLALLAGGLAAVPVPLYTNAEGVIWVSEESRVFASASGMVEAVVTPGGAVVEPGDPLIRSADPLLETQVRLLLARQEEFQARRQLSMNRARAETVLLDEELRSIETELNRALERQAALLTRSPAAGTFVLQDEADLPGRFLRRGEPVGYIVDPLRMRIRTVVTQADVELVRSDVRSVEVRLAEDIGQALPARVSREVPAASLVLPSLAFSLDGGGKFALDPREKEAPHVLERLFQFDLVLGAPIAGNVEERVFVRFEHSPEPLAQRAYRALRRLLLTRIAV